ncbi:MAG TPA: M10 family metallopeptidase [Microvirga sp.]|jgi:serralysin
MTIIDTARASGTPWPHFALAATGLEAQPVAATAAWASPTSTASTNALLSTAYWSGTVSYSFPDSPFDYGYGYAEAFNNFASVSYAQKAAIRAILEGGSASASGPRMTLTPVEGFTAMDFAYLGTGIADIRIAQSSSAGETAYARYPGPGAGGDIWFGRVYDYTKPKIGDYSYMTALHELGHALGLKHAHESGGVSGLALAHARDSLEYTVMTYHSYVPGSHAEPAPNYYTNETYGYAQTFMMEDIAALQALYGVNYGFRAADTVYRWNPATGETFVDGVGQGAPGSGAANRIFLTIWDGGGKDTYDFSAYTTRVTVNLNPGSHVALDSGQRAMLGDGVMARGNIFNALLAGGDLRSLIENAVGGSGGDILKGNAVRNVLRGNGGNDILNGAGGNDVLFGGSGRDTFVFSSGLAGEASMDRIADFRPVDDTIRLENGVFTALTRTGKLGSGAFWTGSSAHDASDRIIYDKTSGALLYDADGTGAAAALRFAQLKAGLTLSAADFIVV